MRNRAGDSEVVWPSDVDAEKSILGAIMLDSKRLVDVVSEVQPEDFYLPAHRAIFEAMTTLDRDSKPVDALTVWDQLRAMECRDLLNQLGGDRYLAELVLDCVSTSSAGFHAASVALKAQRRKWVQAAITVRERGLAGGDDAEFIGASEALLLSLTAQRKGPGAVAIKPVMHSVAKTLEQRWAKRHENAITGVPSGLEDLDALTSGWQSSDLVIIAGRPSMGKTAAALACVEGAAKAKVPCLVFSLEMSKEALAERLVAMDANVDSMQLRTGQMTTATWIALGRSFSRISEYPVWLDDQGALNIAEIRSRARRWRMREVPKAERVMLVVDYVGLARAGQDNGREREVAEISAGLKALAKELKSPVIALSQLNRSCETRNDKRPMLSDLRESGSIEQDADVIAFLYRDEVYHEEPPRGQCDECGKGVAEIIVAKHRNGPIGTVHVAWKKESTKFMTLSRRDA